MKNKRIYLGIDMLLLVMFAISLSSCDSGFVIKNPYEGVDWENLQQYKANFHTHTTRSDGRLNPDTVVDLYHALGYHILAITDHNEVTIQKGVVTIPRSRSAERIISNSQIFDFELSEADMLQIDNLNQDQPMVNRRDRIIHLLEMLRSEKFDLRLLQLLSYAVGDRLQETFNFKTSGQ